MRCNNCGKKVKDDEIICPDCGNYIVQEDEWSEGRRPKIQHAEENPKEYYEAAKKEKPNEKVKEIRIKDASGTRKNQFFYENEDLLEAYIGEDYKLIKKSPFNIWAFLFNWIYFLYRKLYITGIIGLAISYFFIIYFRNYKYILIYVGVVSLLLSLIFSKYYIFVAKKRVEKIKKYAEECAEDDKFAIARICKKKGGVNVLRALLIYLVFLIVLFLSLFPISINKSHNSKFWEENSENLANCTAILRVAYENVLSEKNLGSAEEAICKVLKKSPKEYEIYIKTKYNANTYYSYYATEDGYISLKNRTVEMEDLELKRINGTITEVEESLLAELETIQKNYQEFYETSKEEDKLILKKKNKEEKLNYIFTKEEIIRQK